MTDFFEIDFLGVESSKSGDAIAIRYEVNGQLRIHVVDGGFQDTGDSLVDHINEYFDTPSTIDSVVLTHPDGDHAGGLRKVLEAFHVNELWMLRPWQFAEELVSRFDRVTSVERLIGRLKEAYPNVATLEKIANEKNIRMRPPFQGEQIGDFVVLAPSKERYLDLILKSDKTPDSQEAKDVLSDAVGFLEKAARKLFSFVKAAWGEESFSPEETSAENEMSVIQYGYLLEEKILLTGDAGRGGLSEALEFAPSADLSLPGINYFQVPHHGSRRNVSTQLLDEWLGKRLQAQPTIGDVCFNAIISAAKEDEAHPRKAVVRAIHHRGGHIVTTEGKSICASKNEPKRENWGTAACVPYPEEQETDGDT